MKKKYNIIMPVMEEDVIKVIENYPFLRRYLEFNELFLLCGGGKTQEIESKMKIFRDKKIKCIDENAVLSELNYQIVKQIIAKREGDIKRTGWYLQQFLKLGYAYICKEEYYIVWDSDTVPIKKIELFTEKNKPYFDVKTEYHKPYFNTIENLFDKKYAKVIQESFIAEHMIFKTDFVKEMLKEIEENEKIVGEKFWEKILNAIENRNDLNTSGFSEFETYGTYVYSKYKESYEIRKWKSLREGIFYFPLPLTEEQIEWVAKKYHAISFEKHDTLSKLHFLWNRKFIYKYVNVNVILTISYPYMMCRKFWNNTLKKKK